MNSYGKLSTIFYDLDKPQAPPAALKFYHQHAQAAGEPILEPMCGSGRFLIPMMQAGFEVVGVDASFSMLAACRQRAHQFGLTPNLVHQYLHHMALPGVCKFAMIPDGSFCLLTDPVEAKQALRQIFLALASEATLMVEIDQWLDPHDKTIVPSERSVQYPDGAQIVLRSSGEWDSSGDVMKCSNRYDFIRNGKVIESELEQIDLRYYQPETFVEVLSKAGFDNIHYHSAYDPRQPLDQSESLVFICTRS